MRLESIPILPLYELYMIVMNYVCDRLRSLWGRVEAGCGGGVERKRNIVEAALRKWPSGYE